MATPLLDLSSRLRLRPDGGPLLDLYQRVWKGRKLGRDEFVLWADEKTSIRARLRNHTSWPAQPGRSMRIEHEYKRLGSWA